MLANIEHITRHIDLADLMKRGNGQDRERGNSDDDDSMCEYVLSVSMSPLYTPERRKMQDVM